MRFRAMFPVAQNVVRSNQLKAVKSLGANSGIPDAYM
jgi:hypothetical protein